MGLIQVQVNDIKQLSTNSIVAIFYIKVKKKNCNNNFFYYKSHTCQIV